MKPGAESDPFDEESAEERAEAMAPGDGDLVEQEQVAELQYPDDEPEYPYVIRRKTVKEGRNAVQFYLRPEFADDGERELERKVEEELGTDVRLTDLREAAYAVAQGRPDAVADVLREWGYRAR